MLIADILRRVRNIEVGMSVERVPCLQKIASLRAVSICGIDSPCLRPR